MSELLSGGGWSRGELPTDASSPTNASSCSDMELSASHVRGTYKLLPTKVLLSKEEEEEEMSALKTSLSARIYPTLMRIMRLPPTTRCCKFRGPGSSRDIGYHTILLLPRQ
jgi:hypothetical protein